MSDRERLRWRYTALSAGRWLPVGFVVPVLVLIMQARGLGVGAIGAILAWYGVATMALELPTGGVADAISRRGALVAAAAASAAGSVVLALATSALGLLAGVTLAAVARALGSGPLEAWYVDAARAAAPDTDIGRGLAGGQAAEALALCAGALVGGLLPALSGLLLPGLAASGGDRIITLSVPLLVAAALQAGYLVAVWALVRGDRRGRRPVGSTVSAALRQVHGDRVLRTLIMYAGVLGILLSGVELLTPVSVRGLTGSQDTGAATYGVLVGVGFAVSALGAVLAPRLGRRAGGAAALVWLVAAAGAVLAVGIGIPWLPAAAACYLLLYLTIGINGPLLAGLLHERAASEQRSTVLSLESLSLQGGGAAASAGIGWVAQAAGVPTGLAVVGAAGVAGAVLLRLGARPVRTP